MTADLKTPALQLHAKMKASAEFFAVMEGLESLRRQPLDGQNSVASQIMADLSPILSGGSWREQYYAYSIVATYSMHERFIRDVAAALARLMGLLYSSYDELPEVVRDSHLAVSLKRLQELSRYDDGESLLKGEIRNLADCFDGQVTLNEEAMSRHTANFRCETVRLVLKRFGFELPVVSERDGFEDILENGGPLNGLYATVEKVIDDLADRRNDVAHGSDLEILDIATLRAIAQTVYRYDLWILRKISLRHLQSFIDLNAVRVGTVAEEYKDKVTGVRSVAVMSDIGAELKVGDRAYHVKNDLRVFTVVGIQKNCAAVDAAEIGKGSFGVNCGVRVQKGAVIKVLPPVFALVERVLLATLHEQVEVNLIAESGDG